MNKSILLKKESNMGVIDKFKSILGLESDSNVHFGSLLLSSLIKERLDVEFRLSLMYRTKPEQISILIYPEELGVVQILLQDNIFQMRTKDDIVEEIRKRVHDSIA